MVTSVSTSHLWDIIDWVCVANLWMISHLDSTIKSLPCNFLWLLGTTLPCPKKSRSQQQHLSFFGCMGVQSGFTYATRGSQWLFSTAWFLCNFFRWELDWYQSFAWHYWAWPVYNCRHITKSYLEFIPFHTNRSIPLSLHSLLGTNCFHVRIGIGIANIPMIKLNHPTGNESQLTTPPLWL